MNLTTSHILNIIIVPHPKGNEVIKYAKSRGARGGTTLIGQGTVNNPLLKWLALAENTKDVLLILTENQPDEFLKSIADRFGFHRKNRGIGFSIPVFRLLGVQNSQSVQTMISREVNMINYEAIITIVPKGNGALIVETARLGGAKGATILNARGSGIHETAKLFSIEIEPEKEIVLMVVEKERSDEICKLIIEKTGLDQPGQGILFTQPVNEAVGVNTK